MCRIVLTHLATNWGIFRDKFILWLVGGPESVVALLCFAQERACFRDSFVSFCHWNRHVLELSQGGHGDFLSALGLSLEPCELEEEGHLTATTFPGQSRSQQSFTITLHLGSTSFVWFGF